MSSKGGPTPSHFILAASLPNTVCCAKDIIAPHTHTHTHTLILLSAAMSDHPRPIPQPKDEFNIHTEAENIFH